LRLLDLHPEHERFTPLILKYESTLSQDAIATGTVDEIIRYIEA